MNKRRRAFLSTLAGTTVGSMTGCLRLVDSSASNQTAGGERSATTDIPSGEILWEQSLNERIFHSPVIRDGIAYIVTADTTLHAVSLEGEVQWSETPETSTKTESGPEIGTDGIHFGDTDGNVYKYGFDGTQTWNRELQGPVSEPPTVSDNAVYVTGVNTAVLKLNATDGTTVWRTQSPSPGVLSSPEVGDQHIYVGGFDRLRAIDDTTGDIAWDYNSLSAIKPRPQYTTEGVYTGTDGNRVYAFQPTDGTEKWAGTVSAAVWTTPVVTDTRVVVGTNDGFMIGLSRDTGSQAWKQEAGSPVQADPVIDDGTVYVVSNDGSIAAGSSDDGTPLWGLTVADSFEAGPRLTPGGNVLTASYNGTLRLIAPP
jgi:outer membrane protein assembly factor BamB